MRDLHRVHRHPRNLHVRSQRYAKTLWMALATAGTLMTSISDLLTALKESTVTACEEIRLPLSCIWLPVQTAVLTVSLEFILSAVGIVPILSRYLFPLPVKTSLSPFNLVGIFFRNIYFEFQTAFFSVRVFLLVDDYRF